MLLCPSVTTPMDSTTEMSGILPFLTIPTAIALIRSLALLPELLLQEPPNHSPQLYPLNATGHLPLPHPMASQLCTTFMVANVHTSQMSKISFI